MYHYYYPFHCTYINHCYFVGIISGAVLQLKVQFCLSCLEQEMVISSMLVGAIFGSLVGGEYTVVYMKYFLTVLLPNWISMHHWQWQIEFQHIVGSAILNFNASFMPLAVPNWISVHRWQFTMHIDYEFSS